VIKTEIDSAQSTASPETSKTVPISSLEEEEDEPETGKRNRISRNVEPEVAKRKLTTKNARKRKEETLQKHLPDEDSDDDDDEDFEEDPSEKILKRKKIRFVCLFVSFFDPPGTKIQKKFSLKKTQLFLYLLDG